MDRTALSGGNWLLRREISLSHQQSKRKLHLLSSQNKRSRRPWWPPYVSNKSRFQRIQNTLQGQELIKEKAYRYTMHSRPSRVASQPHKRVQLQETNIANAPRIRVHENEYDSNQEGLTIKRSPKSPLCAALSSPTSPSPSKPPLPARSAASCGGGAETSVTCWRQGVRTPKCRPARSWAGCNSCRQLPLREPRVSCRCSPPFALRPSPRLGLPGPSVMVPSARLARPRWASARRLARLGVTMPTREWPAEGRIGRGALGAARWARTQVSPSGGAVGQAGLAGESQEVPATGRVSFVWS